MRIDSLEQSECDPHIHGEDMQVLGEETVDEGPGEGSCSEDEDLSRMRVFRC